jgi:hypothetical protein
MSWNVHLLSDWTAAGGRPVASLGPVFAGTSIRAELGGRGLATLVLDAEIAYPLATARRIIRVDREQDFFEFRVQDRSRVMQGAEGTRVTITGRPRIYDLSDSDLVRETVGGVSTTRFTLTLPPRVLLTTLCFTNLAADRLVGLTLGDVEFDEPITVVIDRWTRGQLVDAVLEATNGELEIERLEDGTERLHIRRFVGDAAPLLPLRFGDRLQAHSMADDASIVASVARIHGTQPTAESEAASIAENLWRVVNRRTLDDTTIALELRQIGGTGSPILEDGQYCAHDDVALPPRYLQRADGVSRAQILTSSASASEITVATNAPVIGEHVQIVANASGAPIETLELPSALRAIGYSVRDIPVAGGRGERQYAVNGGHESGLAEWAPVNDGVGIEILRSDLGKTVTFAAAGARAGGTGTGTPLTVDGLALGDRRIYRGDRIRTGGAVLRVTAAAIPDSTGAIALTVDPGLPGSYADNDPLPLQRVEIRALQIDGAQTLNPVANNPLVFRDVATDGLSDGPVPGDYLTDSLTAPTWTLSGSSGGGLLTLQYVLGQSGKIRTITPVSTGTLPVGFADGETVYYVRPRETRVLRLDGAHSLGDTTLQFKPVTALATRDWETGDTITIPQEYSGLARITAVVDDGGGQITCTLNTTFSTLDDVDSAVRDGNAVVAIAGAFTATTGGSPTSLGVVEFRVQSIVGDVMVCTALPFYADLVITSLVQDQACSSTWAVPHTYAVTADAAWGTNGRATLTVTIPSGRAIQRGTRIAANWHPLYFGQLFAHAAVTGPASSIEVLGTDRYRSTWSGGSDEATAVYRIAPDASPLGSRFTLLSEQLEVAASTVADGTGAASLTLAAANAVAIPDNAVLTIVRPALVRASDRQSGSILRLFCPAGGEGEPVSSTPGYAHSFAYVRVPFGAAVPLTARGEFSLSIADWYAGQAPAIALVNAVGAILAWAALDEGGVLVEAEPGEITVTARATISESGLYGFRVFGGSLEDASLWCGHRQTFLYVGAALDAPYTRGSHASNTQLVAQRAFLELSTPRITDRVVIADIDVAYAAALGLPISVIPQVVLGGRALLELQNRLLRVVAFIIRPGRAVADVEVGALGTDGGQLLGQAALNAGVRGLR